MVLYGEDEWVFRCVECVGLDGVLHHLLELDLGGQGPAVVDDGLVALPVPAVLEEKQHFGLRGIRVNDHGLCTLCAQWKGF